ncbi:S-ribosylhomocysteine lyase [Streptomyces lunaelactis]|uniref:S-ribosylhomocysteine lyase n=1 Tax=Streptomyces lunaelactis TaxID=1535768 RepID=UPI0015846390|nr:S-ribosylhomocysteine lyase [Streptomyces lunaelactis]NUK86719.1 S-ribosylhomocysteine lyase [Streptomyces lunaelactis]
MADLDHRFVEPPYLRIADRRPAPTGPETIVWHLRISQPNVAPVPWPVLHSIEHFLLYELRNATSAISLAAPMGCGTGLYITASGLDDFDQMAGLVADALTAITRASEVPYATDIHCGRAENHSLLGAQRVATWLLSRQPTWNDPGSSALEV